MLYIVIETGVWMSFVSESNFADSDSGLESPDTIRQQAMILAEWLNLVSKTLKERKKGEWQCRDKVGASFSDKIRPQKRIGDNFRAIATIA